MRRGVLFCDVGGVLVHLEDSPARARWAHGLGVPEHTFVRRVWACISAGVAVPLDEAVTAVGAAFDISPATAEQLLRDFHEHWRLDTELLDGLARLGDRARLAILSNAGPAARFAISTLLHLDRVFDPIVISCEVGAEKPDTAIFRHAERRAGVEARQCVLLDDAEANVVAACREGWGAVRWPSPGSLDNVVELLDRM